MYTLISETIIALLDPIVQQVLQAYLLALQEPITV